ncbi:MAG: hypothetical protein AABW79_00910 [Nanoarchaeota archaeon]
MNKIFFICLCFIVVCSAFVSSLSSDRFASLEDSTYKSYYFNAVHDCEDIAPFFLALGDSRVDIVGIGDSNQGFGGTGWDHGWQYALSSRFPMYATGLITQNENNGHGAGLGYYYSRSSSGPLGNYFGAPYLFDRYLSLGTTSTPLGPNRYMYLPEGEISSFSLQGLSLQKDIPLNISAPLRFHLTYGLFDEGNGSFRPVVRKDEPGYSVLVRSPNIVSTQGEEGSIDYYSLDLPASLRNYSLGFRYVGAGEANLQAPFFGLYSRAENLDRLNGFSFNTLHYGGGYSARDMAEALNSADDETLSQYFKEVRRLQGQNKKVLVRINSGLNDRNELSPSYTQGIVPGNSREAFGDNIQSIVSRIESIWILNGWDVNELYFLIVVSHDVPGDVHLGAYRIEAKQLADNLPRTASVDLAHIVPTYRISQNNWYVSSNDFNHLSTEGYEQISTRELDAIISCI